MNLFLLDTDIKESVRLMEIAGGIRAVEQQQKDCCKLLAAIDYTLWGSTHMLRNDNTPYPDANRGQAIVKFASKSKKMHQLIADVALASAEFAPHLYAAHSILAWMSIPRMAECTETFDDYIVVRHGLPHVYVNSIKEYATLSTRFFIGGTLS